MPKQTEGWEERFDKEFPANGRGNTYTDTLVYGSPDIKRFIQKELDWQMEEVYCGGHMDGQLNAGCKEPSWSNALASLKQVKESL